MQQENLGVVVTYTTVLEAYTLILYRLGNETAKTFLQQIFTGVELVNRSTKLTQTHPYSLKLFP
ncbi:MAG: hypothetical protein F6K54_38120 [Okeania sp. SIO3B5]|uniref:hypothetical protein n=1 Tax=Okeania sp. SIO3B5 TaxID=2607811 RepID=UPI001400B988|nr:hypothetical protein [Okeania sp. SIO3B5]NEO58360.1 hypothetical protein [Okeania sp. SIO3B5]